MDQGILRPPPARSRNAYENVRSSLPRPRRTRLWLRHRFSKNGLERILEVRQTLSRLCGSNRSKTQILQNFEGVLHGGEMLCVLGPPGSGCSSLLKALAGETHGLHLDEKSYLNCKGITLQELRSKFRGEASYTAEDDSHLPMLSVGDTLHFAAFARSPSHRPCGMARVAYARHLTDVVLAAFGISHTKNTRVGNNVSDRNLPCCHADQRSTSEA